MSAAPRDPNEAMADWLGDVINDHAASGSTSDFVLSIDGNRIAYVDVEDCSVWLITVEKARFVPAQSTEGSPA